MEPGPSAVNQSELMADVRNDFIQLEAAISTARPELGRPYVAPELYEELVGLVRELNAHGRRRVHGSFEIVDTQLLSMDTTPFGVPRATLRLEATSSLAEIDRHGRLVQGSDQLQAWTQDLEATHPEAINRWLISKLGVMTISGPVSGPSGPPRQSAVADELERRLKEDESHSEVFVGATLTFMSLRY
jgi:hypothetical protein